MRTLALVMVVSLPGVSAFAATCSSAELSDTVCDCGCGATDPACHGAATFAPCEVSHCSAGQVPWEHAPSSCMSSACGDGWVDTAAGEVCDDGNALASGGCSADCHSVNPGYTCGSNAKGCQLAPIDAGSQADAGAQLDAGMSTSDAGAGGAGGGSAGTADAGVTDPMPRQGCDVSSGWSLLALLALGAMRRARG